MALLVLLRGVNVGGHKTFRPAALAAELKHLGAVNIGAAGTFVIRQRIARAVLREELARRLPFSTGIAICEGRLVVRLVSSPPFAVRPAEAGIVRFVSVLLQRPRSEPRMPIRFPTTGEWMLRVLATDGPFVCGEYRRQMRAIGYLGMLDKVFGVPLTTRSWTTMTAIAKVLDAPPVDHG